MPYTYFDETEQIFIGVHKTKDTGKICPYYILPKEIPKRVAGFHAIKQDLEECKETKWCLRSVNDQPKIPAIVKSSLLFRSIVQYAKCFNSADGRGTTLDPTFIRQRKGADYFKLHNDIIDIRNQYIAHAGETGHESYKMIIVLSQDDKKIEDTVYASVKLRNLDSELERFHQLIKFSLEHVEQELEALKPAHQKFIDALDIDDIYAKSIIPPEDEWVWIDSPEEE